jgi:hypothetical protein
LQAHIYMGVPALSQAWRSCGTASAYKIQPITSHLTTHYSLLTTHYSLRTAHYSLRATHYSLRTTHYALLTTHYSLNACSRDSIRVHLWYFFTRDEIISRRILC